MSKPPPIPPTDGLDGSRVPSVSVPPAGTQPTAGVGRFDIELQPLIRNFCNAVESTRTAESLFRAIFNIIDAETDCLAMWWVQVESAESSLQTLISSDDNAAAVWMSVEAPIDGVVRKASELGQICSTVAMPDRKYVVVAAPLAPEDSSSQFGEILAACFAANDQTALRLQWLLGIASQSVSRWRQRRQMEIAQTQSQTLTNAVSLFDTISDSKNSNDAAIAIVNDLRRLSRANQVALAEVDVKGKSTLLAVSDVEKLDPGSANNKLLCSAIAQSVTTGTTITYPNQDVAQDAAYVLPLENWCAAAGASSAISLPMELKDGSIIGSLLVTFGDDVGADQQRAYVENMTGLIAKQFDVVNRANRSTGQRLGAKLNKERSTTRKVLVGLLLLAGLMAVPMPYRVKCDCQIQPIQRRFVAAPYNGVLEKSLVEVGAVVTKDQVIARLDGRQLRIELAGLEAEYEGARRRRDSSLAMREIAQSQIEKSEMNRLSAQIKLLNNRIKDLEVRSPIDGVIVVGDMDKVQGAPLEMGQNLFEVAPLETMVAEIGIPESEIHYVKDDDVVTLKINSFPFEKWSGKVERIHPSAEIIGDETVFVAEVEIDNLSGELRPGMEGSAKISTRWSPIGWNLFHNAWETLRYWTIW